MKIYAYDTNALLKLGKKAYEHTPFFISSVTLEELEHIKSSRDKSEEVKFQARRAIRLLDRHPDDYKVIPYTDHTEMTYLWGYEKTPDNKICACMCQVKDDGHEYFNEPIDFIFITDDIACKTIARQIFGLDVQGVGDFEDEYYLGYKEVTLNDEGLAYFYEHLGENQFGLIVNEYLIIKNLSSETVDKLKWTGEFHKTVCNKTIKTNMFGTCKPLDDIQACALDTISSNEITVLYGRAGSGKTTLPLNYMIQQLEKGNIKQIYVVYSYEPLRNARELGYEAGDHTTKLIQSASIGNILGSKFGDIEQVQYMLDSGKIDIIPTANIRGVEFSADSCVLVTEAQNLDVYTLKTIIQRCKEGCKQVYEGDIIEQRDTNIVTSGISRLIEVFKGHESFGCIKLKHNYRNPLGELADKL